MPRHALHASLIIVLLATCGLACEGTELPKDDVAVSPDQGSPDMGVGLDQSLPDQSLPDLAADQATDSPVPDAAPSLKVAAVQYCTEDLALVAGCSDSLCAVEQLVKQAAQQGAQLVVLPWVDLGQTVAELAPVVNVSNAQNLPAGLIKSHATIADDQNVTLVFHVVVQEGAGSAAKMYSAVIVADKNGTIIARHYKFELYGPDVGTLTPGASLATSFFDTSAGKVGLLMGADVQCIVLNMVAQNNCTTHAVSMLQSFAAQSPDIVVNVNYWFAKGDSDPIWNILNVAAKVATTYGAWMVEANHTNETLGYGGGIWDSSGTAVHTGQSATPTIFYADIPGK